MNVLLADDHALFREGLKILVKKSFPAATIYQASNWMETKEYTQRYSCDIALVDLFMPQTMSWEEELSALVTQNSLLKVCVVSASNFKMHMETAAEMGAVGYIQKTAGINEIQYALKKIQKGEGYFSSQFANNRQASSSVTNIHLTVRQKEILMLVAEGKSNKEIANKFNIAESTVKRHVHNIFNLLEAKNRTNAVELAKQKGLIFY